MYKYHKVSWRLKVLLGFVSVHLSIFCVFLRVTSENLLCWTLFSLSVRTVVISGKAPVDPECTSMVGKSQVYCEGNDIWDCMLNQVSHTHADSVYRLNECTYNSERFLLCKKKNYEFTLKVWICFQVIPFDAHLDIKCINR